MTRPGAAPTGTASEPQCRHWAYVSRCILPVSWSAGAVDDIVRRARLSNFHAGISGALLFTGEHFAQYIEGPADALQRLQDRIGADRRHTDLSIVAEGTRPDRIFTGWSLAYDGTSTYLAATIARMWARESGADDLMAILHAFLPVRTRPA